MQTPSPQLQFAFPQSEPDAPNEAKPAPFPALLRALKDADQDHEFYPTTNEILAAVVKDLRRVDRETHLHFRSVLDLGAGNGKVLKTLREEAGFRELFAIEKSALLCESLDPDILIVGTEFWEQSLFSKPVDVIFCNPPYSQFEAWTEKVIRQAASYVAYLVIPRRWAASTPIQDALTYRNAEAEVVGSFDFEDAEDRKARAKVDLLRVRFGLKHGDCETEKDDAFERFFKEQFAGFVNQFEGSEGEDEESEAPAAARVRPFQQLVVGPNYPDALVSIYNEEMANVERNYRMMSELDPDLLREFGILPDRVMKGLKERLKGLRHDYWHELFSKLDTITSRLTSKSRNDLLGVLQKHVQVDFTVQNICAVVLWVIKNANRYLDSQLVSAYERMVAKCNVQLYKSNQRTFQEDRWRYNADTDTNTHYALDYRIVTHQVGGCCNDSDWGKGLKEPAAEFLGDLLTIANNLGFRCDASSWRLGWDGRESWRAGREEAFTFTSKQNRPEPLMKVRAFKNRNLHLRLNQDFILALNVEYGRLKGWLKSGAEAAEELNDPKAAAFFHTNLSLNGRDLPLLLAA